MLAFLDHIYRYRSKLLLSHVLSQQGFPFLLFLKVAAPGGSGSATLLIKSKLDPVLE